MPPATCKDSTVKIDSTVKPAPEQLGLRLFATVSSYRKAPPERALWRILLDLAIGQTKKFTVAGYVVSAAHVWATGAALYFRANAAGIIEGFSAQAIAKDCRIGERAVRAALELFRQLRILTTTRPRPKGKRGRGSHPAVYRMNVGGLDWPAVRRRAATERREQAQQLSLADPNLTDGPCGHGDRVIDDHAVMVTALKGYVPEGLQDDPTVVAQDLTRARPESVQKQQQHVPESRVNGLIAAIAARSRELGMLPYNEEEERGRLARGEITVDDLQRLANELLEEIISRRPRVRL
jgi:hypothetical protein